MAIIARIFRGYNIKKTAQMIRSEPVLCRSGQSLGDGSEPRPAYRPSPLDTKGDPARRVPDAAECVMTIKFPDAALHRCEAGFIAVK